MESTNSEALKIKKNIEDFFKNNILNKKPLSKKEKLERIKKEINSREDEFERWEFIEIKDDKIICKRHFKKSRFNTITLDLNE